MSTTAAPESSTPPPPAVGSPAATSGDLVAAVAQLVLPLAALLPMLTWFGEMRPEHAVVGALHAVVCGVGAALSIGRRFRPCLMVASVFPYCWLVVPSMYQVAHVQAAWGDPGVTLDFSATLRAQLVLLIAQVALTVGYLAVSLARGAAGTRGRSAAHGSVGSVGHVGRVGRSGRAGSRVVEHLRSATPVTPTEIRRLLLSAYAFLAGAVLLLPLLIGASGGVGTLFSSRDEVSSALNASGIDRSSAVVGGLVQIAPSSLGTAAALLAIWAMRSSARGSASRRWGVLALVLAGGVLFVSANPFAVTRYIALVAYGTVLLALLYPRGRLAGAAWLTGAVGVLLLAYPAANYFRYGRTDLTGEPVLASRDFDGFQQAINTVGYVDAHGLDWAIHLISGALFFVPRALWSGKAEPSTFAVAEDRGYLFQDLSMPFPSEVYLDLGWVGVAVVLVALGVVWARLDLAWAAGSRGAVFAAYTAIAQVGLWRGPFGSLAPVFGSTVILLLAALAFAGLRFGSARRAARTPVPLGPAGGPARSPHPLD